MATQQYPSQDLSHTYPLKDEIAIKKWKPEQELAKATKNNISDGFDCNICLDSVQDPVITLCGHLYCWPCIYKWIHHQTVSSDEKKQPQCPVCKSNVSQQSLVPLYGRGNMSKTSDDSSLHKDLMIPKRPSSPRCGVHTSVPSSPRAMLSQTQQLHHRDYQQVHQAGGNPNLVNPTMGVFGEAIYARVFGNGETTLYSYPNTYDLVGSISSPRLRRHVMETDKSLSRLSFFLCCCIILCLLLF